MLLNNKQTLYKNDLNICLKGELTVHSCRSFAFSSHSKLMFFDDIIIQPHCKMVILLCFQSVNHYTSMLLSFLGVFEIHSVDWFGLVFVLPLLKNKKYKLFSVHASLLQSWFSSVLRPERSIPGSQGHIWCFHSVGSPSTVALLPKIPPRNSTELACMVFILFCFQFPSNHTSRTEQSFQRRTQCDHGCWELSTSLVWGWPEGAHSPLNPCPRCSPPTPVGTTPLPTLGTPASSLFQQASSLQGLP